MAEGSTQYEDDTVSFQCSSTRSLEWNILLQANDEEEMNETILTKIPYNSTINMDMFRHYNDKTYIYDNKYYVSYDTNTIYHRHHYCACGCVHFHRFYVCKHLLALARLLKLRLKGFVSEGFFATRNKPGKKKSNCLNYD